MNIYHCYEYFSTCVDIQQRISGNETLINRFLELAEYLYKELSSKENFELVFDDEVNVGEWNIFLYSDLYILTSTSHMLSYIPNVTLYFFISSLFN